MSYDDYLEGYNDAIKDVMERLQDEKKKQIIN